MSKVRTSLVIVMFAAAHGSVDFYVSLLQALAPGMASRLDLPIGTVVALVGAAQLVTNGIQPLAGWIMGKRNLSWILWFRVMLAVLPAFMGWVSTFWALVALVALGGIGTGIFHPEGVLAAHERSGEYAHLGVPLFMAGGYFLSAAAAPIAIHWVDAFGFPALAWLAIPGLGLGALLFFRHRQKRRQHPSVFLRPRSRRVTKREDGKISFWPLLGVAICTNVATGLFMAILTSHYELSFGSDARVWAGWVLLIIGGGGSLASFMWGSLCRRGGYYVAIFLTQIAAAPLFLLLGYASSPANGLLLSIPLSVIPPGAIYPVSVSLARNASGSTQSLRAGLMVGGTWGVSALAVMLAGFSMRWGAESTHLVAVSAVSCLCAAFLAGMQLLAGRRK